jgi:hypothetical protein
MTSWGDGRESRRRRRFGPARRARVRIDAPVAEEDLVVEVGEQRAACEARPHVREGRGGAREGTGKRGRVRRSIGAPHTTKVLSSMTSLIPRQSSHVVLNADCSSTPGCIVSVSVLCATRHGLKPTAVTVADASTRHTRAVRVT